ncbi:hypothetical protein K438DRAFT_2025870 [Mycena galopus ATCC 62051]|nr:hypothetical protein K438DRAFT_2025870 [Mycena galopus ATCC 62051]
MTSKIEVLKARLVIAQSKEKATSKKSKKDKENDDVTHNAGKKDAKKEAKGTRNAPVVQWAKEEFYYLTSELLTVIEGKARYRQALGFAKGINGPVDTGGKKLPAILADIAEDLFIKDKSDTKYTTEDLPVLAGVVKNRVAAMKTKYTDYHKKLGATGHGLIAAGKADEITGGTVIANAWEEITQKFPWYMRMDTLMGTSPVVNRSAVAHSQTRVDLGVLDRSGEAHDGPIELDSDDDSDGKISNWGPSSPTPIGANEDDDGTDSPVTPAAKVKKEVPVATLSSARGSKRKSIHDHIQDVAAQNSAQKLKLAEVKEQQRTVCAKAKYEAKNTLELARFQHQQREAERQRDHELQMLERQMQLEAMRRNAPGPVAGMYGAGAPAYGAPPPNSIFDPALGM